jgi:membrane-associated protein
MCIAGLPVIFCEVLLFFDAESLIRYGGLLLLILVIFANTGLFFLFFLPSGAVLFAGGLFTASSILHNNVYAVSGFLSGAALLGNCTGYWIGYKSGPSLYRRQDSRFYRKRYLTTAEVFYRKYGWLAITAGFFIPLIRSFSPVVAGMVRMRLRKFVFLSLIGGAAWVFAFVLSGYYLGSHPLLKTYMKYIVAAFILLVSVPVIVRTLREMRRKDRGAGLKG